MNTVHIASVTSRQTLRGVLFRIVDSTGTRFSCYDPWVASLCLQAQRQGFAVRLTSSAGWHDRTLRHVKRVDDKAVSA